MLFKGSMDQNSSPQKMPLALINIHHSALTMVNRLLLVVTDMHSPNICIAKIAPATNTIGQFSWITLFMNSKLTENHRYTLNYNYLVFIFMLRPRRLIRFSFLVDTLRQLQIESHNLKLVSGLTAEPLWKDDIHMALFQMGLRR